MSADTLIDSTHSAVGEHRLYRCLICSALSCVPQEWLVEGGTLYTKATDHYTLEDKQSYNFPMDGVIARYDQERDQFVPLEVRAAVYPW